MSFHAGMAGERLLGHYFLPPCLTGAAYHNFLWKVLPGLLEDVDLWPEFIYNLFYIFFLQFGNLVRVSGTMDRTRWANSFACSFPWFKSLRLLSKLSDLYSLPNNVRVVKSRRMRWAGHVAHVGERRGVHRVLVGKPEGKRPLERPRCRWEDNIKMDLQEVGGGCEDWMELA